MRLAFIIPPMMLLAACGPEDTRADGTTEVSINAGGDGGVKIQTGKDGSDFTISFAPDGKTSKGEVLITKS